MNNSPLYYKLIPFKGKSDNVLVFLHGFLETHQIWYHLPLSQLERPILLIDIPGFGKSALQDDNNPSIYYYALEVCNLISNLSITSYQVVGHSMGGYVGLEMLQIDERMEKLILLNSNFWTDSNQKKVDRTRVAEILIKSKELLINEAIPNLFIDKLKHLETIKTLVEEAKQGIGEWYAYASLAMRNRTDYSEYVAKNPHKIGIIQGEQDTLIPTEIMLEKIQDILPVHVVEASGHMSLFERPEEVITLLQHELN